MKGPAGPFFDRPLSADHPGRSNAEIGDRRAEGFSTCLLTKVKLGFPIPARGSLGRDDDREPGFTCPPEPRSFVSRGHQHHLLGRRFARLPFARPKDTCRVSQVDTDQRCRQTEPGQRIAEVVVLEMNDGLPRLRQTGRRREGSV